MTAPDYVAQAAELIAKHQVCGLVGERMSCGTALPAIHGDAPFWESHMAEVLAAAGLLPTSTETRVHYACDDDPKPPLGVDEDDDCCGYTLSHGPGGITRAPCKHTTTQTRPAHDWKDATDDDIRTAITTALEDA